MGYKTNKAVDYSKSFFLSEKVFFPEFGWALYLSGTKREKSEVDKLSAS